MRDYTELNLNLLEQHAHFIHFPEGNDASRVKIVETQKPDSPTLMVRLPGRDLYIHSRFDPLRDARRWVKQQNLKNKSGFLFVFGLGLGYHVEALLKEYPDIRKIFVFEVSRDIFLAALAARDFSELLNSDRVIILAGGSAFIQDSIHKFMTGFTNITGGAEDTEILIHRPSLEVFPEESEELRSILEYLRLASNERTTFDKERRENASANADAFHAAPGVKKLFGSYAGRDIIVAAAGPSLDQSLELLKSAPAAPDIIAVDSALAPFHRAGLRPKYVISGDPQAKAADLFARLSIESEQLVFFQTTNPDVVARFSPDQRWAADSSVGTDKNESSFTHEKGGLFFSGTVFLAAVDFAVKVGAKPIVLIGADFSFLDTQTHATGSRTQGYNPRYGRFREVIAIDGSMIETSDILHLYLKDMEKYNLNLNEPDRIFNATSRGAAIFHMPHIRFERYLEEYSKSHGAGD